MSLFTGITSPYKLGGIFGLSSYMLMPDRIRTFIPQTPKPPPRQVGDEGGVVEEEEEVDEDRGANAKTKIWMGHGEDDPLVRMDWGRQTAGLLGAWGWSVELKAYEGLEHNAAVEEIDDLEVFVKACLAANPYVEDGAGEASTAESKAGAEKAAGRSPL
jgi:predicted esterase